jgi:hypothetical protein
MAEFDPVVFKTFIDSIPSTIEGAKELRKAFAELSGEQTKAVKDLGALTAKQLEIAEARKRQLEQIKLSAAAQRDEAQSLKDLAEGTREQISATIELTEAEIELAEARANAETDATEKQKQINNIKNLKKQLKDLEKQYGDLNVQALTLSDTLEGMAKQLSNLGKDLFSGGNAGEKIFGTLSQSAGIAGQSIKTNILQSLPRAGPPMVALAGLALEAGKAFLKLASEMVDTSNAIQKATGVNAQFADSITMGYKETRQFGGTLKDLETVAVDLSKTFTDFTMLNGQMAQSLARTGTLLGKLGVSSQDFAKGIQLSTKAFGMTVEEAEEAQLRLAALAQDIGVAPSQMAADFAAAGPQLAKFGSNAEATFKRLAVTAKSTGIEINRLLSITEKFDTFEGAATQAGKLNAALGGNFVNAMELLTETDPAARFDMMTDAIKDAGLSFDEMSYYQKKFYAESMGFSDVNELALALSGNTELLSQNLGKTSAEIEETAKRAQQMQSIQEQLNLLFADMVPIIEPVIAGMRDFVGFLLENKEGVKAFFVGLTIAAVAFAAAIAPMGFAIAGITAAFAALGYLFFKQTWASSFLDGIGKIGNGFGSIAEMAGMASGDVKSLTGDMDGLGQSMFKGKSIKVGAEMTSTALEGMQESTMAAASTTKAAAPVLATSNAVSNAVSNASTTNNNYNGSTGETKVNINFANKRFKDFFDVEVENSIGRAARKAVI